MKKILTSFILFIAIQAYPCGYDGYDDYFYSLIDQEMIEDRGMYPFLRAYYTYYETDEPEPVVGNIRQWQELLPKWSVDDIQRALTTESEEGYQQLWKKYKRKYSKDVKAYIDYARDCSMAIAVGTGPSWSYDDILAQGKVDGKKLIAQGKELISKCKSKQLKLRYTYQLVRLYYHNAEHARAIELVKEQNLTASEGGEIYYYMLERVAGCYYALNRLDTAAYMYLKVFSQSVDRKKEAYLSYRFCTNRNAEGIALLSSHEDTLTYITLRGIREFSEGYNGIRDMARLAPNDKRLELLVMRSINEMERELWPVSSGMEGTDLPVVGDVASELDALIQLCTHLRLAEDVDNKEYWAFTSSYLHFISGQLEEAKTLLAQIKSDRYQTQKELLAYLYEVLPWNSMDKEKEKYLCSFITKEDLHEAGEDYFPNRRKAFIALVLNKVGHLYYKDGKIAQAYLIYNSIDGAYDLFSIDLLDDLIAFFKQENKGAFGELLEAKSSDKGLKDVYYLKGLYYMQIGDPVQARVYLDKSGYGTYANDEGVHTLVDARIFSNNVIECFDCKRDSIMVDSVYLASAFSFINPTFNRSELCDYLIRLEKMSEGRVKWKRKLANYLLGNYYYNISTSGFYRGTLSGQSRFGNYYYFNEYSSYWGLGESLADALPKGKGYNMKGANYFYKSYFKMAQKAYGYYQKTIEESSDKELNARCLYMMAKCELNTMYNQEDFEKFSSQRVHDHWGYVGQRMDYTETYQTSFKRLHEEYRNTQFHKEILKECSFYRYYCEQ